MAPTFDVICVLLLASGSVFAKEEDYAQTENSFKALFSEFDSDKRGCSINRPEFVNLWLRLRLEDSLVSEDGLQEAFKKADKDGDKKIEYGDFKSLVKGISNKHFNDADGNKDSTLTLCELRAWLESKGKTALAKYVHVFINKIAQNKNQITPEEFLRVVSRSVFLPPIIQV